LPFDVVVVVLVYEVTGTVGVVVVVENVEVVPLEVDVGGLATVGDVVVDGVEVDDEDDVPEEPLELSTGAVLPDEPELLALPLSFDAVVVVAVAVVPADAVLLVSPEAVVVSWRDADAAS
jgi:hypothetical protein